MVENVGSRSMRILNLNTKLGELRARFGKRKKTVVTKTVMLDRYTNRRNERQNDDYRASTEPATKILRLKKKWFFYYIYIRY